jgi:hypothetical protein
MTQCDYFHCCNVGSFQPVTFNADDVLTDINFFASS